MRKNKKVCYTIPNDVLSDLNKYTLKYNIKKSHFIKDSIARFIGYIESEIDEEDIEYFNHHNKNLNTSPIIITIPKDLLQQMDNLCEKYSMKKSHFVFYGLVLLLDEKTKQQTESEIQNLVKLVEEFYVVG